MSTFRVTVETVGAVSPAKNSDFLDLVSLEGKDYDFITQRDLYDIGDTVIYFPIDSLLPEWILDALEMGGKLAHGAIPEDGSERLRNRVKTIKLRGNLSQGIVCKPEVLILAQESNPDFDPDGLNKPDDALEWDVTQLLGVEHYEPPVISSKAGNLVKMPHFVSPYKIERAQNYTRIADLLMDVPVFVSEKVEGSNWWASLSEDGEFIVGQRNYAIEQQADKVHDWHKVAEMYGIEQALRKHQEYLRMCGATVHTMTLRGEIVGSGIQGNYYKTHQHELFMFDLEVNQDPLDSSEFMHSMREMALPSVPILSRDVTLREWLDGKTLKDASNGKSLINSSRKREGLVIKPMKNMPDDEEIGRVFLKMPSPEYLAKSEY